MQDNKQQKNDQSDHYMPSVLLAVLGFATAMGVIQNCSRDEPVPQQKLLEERVCAQLNNGELEVETPTGMTYKLSCYKDKPSLY
jgi:hypothetical protein